MKILSLATVLLLAATGTAHAQNAFTIKNDGTTVGKCTYTFDKSKNGYKIVSRYDAQFVKKPSTSLDSEMESASNVTMNQVQQVHTYKLDDSYNYLGGNIVDNITQMNNGYSPNKDRTSIQLSSIKGGTQDPPRQLALMPGLIVLPDYDASAVQDLLYEATTHPTSNSLYFIIIPGKNGLPSSVQSHWVPQAAATGTLAGKPLTLHHYGFVFGKHVYDVYADDTNTLMEVDISGLHISYIRNGFALDAAAAPAAK